MLLAVQRNALRCCRRRAAARSSDLHVHRVLAGPIRCCRTNHARSFAAQMSWIADYFRVLPLPEAVRTLAQGTLPARAAASRSTTVTPTISKSPADPAGASSCRRRCSSPSMPSSAASCGTTWSSKRCDARRRSSTCRVRRRPLSMPDGRVARRRRRPRAEPSEVPAVGERWQRADEMFRSIAGAAPPRLMMTPAACDS